MPKVQTTLKSRIIDLASEALTRFCDDMSGMFGVEMSCEQVDVSEDASAEIKTQYKKLGAVYSVNVSGTLNDDFQILIDKAGLFTVTGVVVMLPKSRILSSAKRGTLADAEEISDAVGEVGNLMIGSWDRIFRAGLDDNTHFSHTGTFVGDPCAEDNGVLDLASDEEVTFVSYEMSVGEYPAFKCGVYLPTRLFDEAESDPEPDTQDEVEQAVVEQALPDTEAAVVETPEPVAAIAPEPASQETSIEPDDAKAEAAPTETADPVAVAAQEPDSPETPTPPDDAEAEAAPTETADPVAVAAQEPDSQETSTPPDDAEAEAELSETSDPVAVAAQEPDSQETSIQPDAAQVEAVPTEGQDSVLMTAQPVSVNPGAGLLAKDLMQTQVYWVSAEDTVNQAQTKMQEIGVSYLLVGDGTKLEGIVTRSDLASAASIYLRPIFSKWRRPEDDATLQIRLKWIMSKQIYSVKPETPLFNIIHLKCKYDISCLPVVDAQGQVFGVVTTKDVLKDFLNKDLSAMGVAVA